MLFLVTRDRHLDGKSRLLLDDLLTGYNRFVVAKSPPDLENPVPDTYQDSTKSDDVKKEAPFIVNQPAESPCDPKPVIKITQTGTNHSEKEISIVPSEQKAADLEFTKDMKKPSDPFSDFVFLKLAYTKPDEGWTILQKSGNPYLPKFFSTIDSFGR
jgi:hypothetical protein